MGIRTYVPGQFPFVIVALEQDAAAPATIDVVFRFRSQPEVPMVKSMCRVPPEVQIVPQAAVPVASALASGAQGKLGQLGIAGQGGIRGGGLRAGVPAHQAAGADGGGDACELVGLQDRRIFEI
jgi:hypothetical protein